MSRTAADTSKTSGRYREMLALPQWQKRRLQMLEKAGWRCVECGAEEQQLHVHHRRYIAGAKPWEYEDVDLAVLCEQCHEKAHGRKAGDVLRARIPHEPPSAIRALLHLILQNPARAARLPADLIPTDSAEGRALIAIIELTSPDEAEQTEELGGLIERFRDTPHAETLALSVAELVEDYFDDAAAEEHLDYFLRRLQIDSLSVKISSLLQRGRASLLTGEDREQLSALLLEKRQLNMAADEAKECAKKGGALSGQKKEPHR